MKSKIAIGLKLLSLFFLALWGSNVLSSSSHCSKAEKISCCDSIDCNVLDNSQGWVKKKIALIQGDCILIVKAKSGEYPLKMPAHDRLIKYKEDSFYSEPVNDTIFSHCSCDRDRITALWRQCDSISNGSMEVFILRADTVLCHKNFEWDYSKRIKDTIPFSRYVQGLEKVYIHEYRFKDIDKARTSFRALAFASDIVMRGDTNWLHLDNGTFYVDPGNYSGEKYVNRIKRKYFKDHFEAYYFEQRGRIEINCDKKFYTKFHLYVKSEFYPQKRFSFVIYKKIE